MTLIDGDPRILVRRDRSGMEALLPATLHYDTRSRCLVLRGDNQNIIPIWPSGTNPVNRAGRRGVESPDGTTVLEGNDIKATGGFLSRQDAAADCLSGTGQTAVFAIASFVTSSG
ncbi:hypothetical protein [Nonomuraea candida]|uniref:hypothetical protein n=1 Tax=Nonomuraea candida TaxID=359159 RepID=UPI0012F79830|nr:hypothetical protein [Nonomuraea candida]